MNRYRPLLPDLIALYQDEGYHIATGLHAKWVGPKMAEFTHLLKDGVSQTIHLGIGLKEIYFLEVLFSGFQPHRSFVIGNSFGWSSLAVAMLNPEGKTVAVELGSEPFTQSWIERTNHMAGKGSIPLRVVQGKSPDNTHAIISEHFGGNPLNFVFIDGLHTCEQVRLDFEAALPHCDADTVFLFHDAIEFKLYPEIQRIAKVHGLNGAVFFGTPSGMAMLWNHVPPTLTQVRAAFSATDLASLGGN